VVGVCGRGVDMGNAPTDVELLDNVIVETGLSAILMNGSLLNGNTLYGNIIRRASGWPDEQGFNDFVEDAIAYGPEVPAVLKSFQPAEITTVSGTSVSGTSGQGSPCGLCTVELFLDDTDAVTETLQSLAQVTADASGNWSATLPAPLQSSQGLRTMSTVPDSFTIIGLDPGTTSNLSALQGSDFRILLPLCLRNM
jgi:VCBS repeat-containing protein